MRGVPRLQTLARIGFGARGMMYVLVGGLALSAGRTADGSDVLERLNGGAGRLLLAAMSLGFLGYAVWRLSEAIVDADGNGRALSGLAVRCGGAISAIVHFGLFVTAASLLLGGHGGSGSGETAREGAATALHLPAGGLLLGLASAGLLLTAALQFRKAAKADFLGDLHSDAARRRWVEVLGRAGYAARGIVFLAVGWFLLRAAAEHDAGQAAGMADVLASFSPGLRAGVAAGLLLFGLFSLVEARFRRIADPQVLQRLRAQGARLGA
ncbi:DUF1206 domain-containing protein [Sphingomonas parva]|nr:DUF1206 domain-containing protein [Sphingomonas parva]